MYFDVNHYIIKYLGEPIGLAHLNPNLKWRIKGNRLSEYHPETFSLTKINKAEYGTHMAFGTFPELKIRYPKNFNSPAAPAIIGLTVLGLIISIIMLSVS